MFAHLDLCCCQAVQVATYRPSESLHLFLGEQQCSMQRQVISHRSHKTLPRV